MAHLLQFKGNDDLRQDAVMEQVFELVNNILRRDRETKRRDLTIRVYKVIPLDSQAGVLEFVGNTIPLANWLKTAHARYDVCQSIHFDFTFYIIDITLMTCPSRRHLIE